MMAADMTHEQKSIADLYFGFLGSGKMSQAISKGLLTCGLLKGSQITMTDKVTPSDSVFYKPIEDMQKTFGVTYLTDNVSMATKSDVIFVCVKPYLAQVVLRECQDVLAGKLIVSIAAGVTVEALESVVPPQARVIRVMPNMPCMVQQGAGIFTRGCRATEADSRLTRTLLAPIFPVLEEIPQSQFNAATAVSGCGPAYVCMMLEAMADGGVRMGLARDLAHRLAVQTALGTAALLRDSGIHPAQLRDEVCSPGGSSIVGTHVLEKAGIRGAFNDCVAAATARNDQLSAPE